MCRQFDTSYYLRFIQTLPRDTGSLQVFKQHSDTLNNSYIFSTAYYNQAGSIWNPCQHTQVSISGAAVHRRQVPAAPDDCRINRGSPGRMLRFANRCWPCMFAACIIWIQYKSWSTSGTSGVSEDAAEKISHDNLKPDWCITEFVKWYNGPAI